MEITSIEFALLSKEIIGGVGQAEPAMTLVDSAFPSLPIAAISIDALAVTPPSSVFVLSGLPIGPGVYNGLFSFSGGGVLPFSARVGYEAKFTVAAASVVRSHQHFCC